ncbi:hypothetical protein WOLCODRAFT_167715 [Wolfiporia cocos MD-104 SS10]|uniref:Uncharacterized protein n=1 Tax=Wolfiporia cocos (strain MD-104) TaxID=742152 RepID=A0A2H3JJI5_WOLCO|nr:hypothetical protein WOLCODRAFT_167715 [Wolfiporia cocos MD-104 SS10]
MFIVALPTELLREIVWLYVFDTCLSDKDADTQTLLTKPPWVLIEPLTVASQRFRPLTLEAWFQTFTVRRPDWLLNLDAIPQVTTWARQVHCIDSDRALHQDDPPWNLCNFGHITKLRLDVDPIDFEYRVRFLNVPPTLHELQLCNHPELSPRVVKDIARVFPELRVLKLSQSTVWCGLCYTCNVPSFKAQPPSPLIYTNGNGLPIHYNSAWSSLKHLHTVQLTLGYELDGETSVDEENKNIWCGECDQCMSRMYPDEDFRMAWVHKKTSVLSRPPSLRRVEWRFKYLDLPVETVEAILDEAYENE